VTDDPLTQARLLLDLREYAEALGAAAEVLAIDPQSVHGLCITAVSLGHLKRTAEGLAAADRAAALDPTDDWPQRIRVSLLLELGREREALEAAREAVRLAPGVPDCWYLLVKSLVSMPGGVNEAKAAIAYALPYFPEASEIHEAAGLVAVADRDWRTAQIAFKRAVDLRPDDEQLQAALQYVETRLYGRRAGARGGWLGGGGRDEPAARHGAGRPLDAPPPPDARPPLDAPPPPPDWEPPDWQPPERRPPPDDFWGRPPS
jgi:tetratricopeptide (TPR) repeat protein